MLVDEEEVEDRVRMELEEAFDEDDKITPRSWSRGVLLRSEKLTMTNGTTGNRIETVICLSIYIYIFVSLCTTMSRALN